MTATDGTSLAFVNDGIDRETLAHVHGGDNLPPLPDPEQIHQKCGDGGFTVSGSEHYSGLHIGTWYVPFLSTHRRGWTVKCDPA
jgi:hypothetical protein